MVGPGGYLEVDGLVPTSRRDEAIVDGLSMRRFSQHLLIPPGRGPMCYVVRAIAALLLLWVSALLVICWRIHSSNASENHVLFQPESPPAPRQRILVVSPHCDDETLGAGGYITAAVLAGADVRILMVTNGDGFGLAAALHYKQIHVTPALLRSFAYDRQKEAVDAVRALGVPANHVTFLGFPDRGLADLWSRFWTADHPYFSRFTFTDHNPYTTSPHPGEPYCGERLLNDIEEQMSAFQPDVVLTLHPNDDHPDHRATSSFVRAAIADRQRMGDAWALRVVCQVFVVHHGDWPIPQGYHPGVRLAPPFSLVHPDTQWSELMLTPKEEKSKLSAIQRYRSQMALMGRFLVSFVRRTECFGRMQPVMIDLGRDNVPSLVETGAVGDTLLRAVERDGNIENIEAAGRAGGLLLRVQLRSRVSQRVSYTLQLQSISYGGGEVGRWHVTVRGSNTDTDIPGAQASIGERTFQVWIPATLFRGRSDWFVSADTHLSSLQLDRTGWREMHILVPARRDSTPA